MIKIAHYSLYGGNNGERIKGFKCPKCRRESIVYNGNYFCDFIGVSCSWALGDGKAVWNRYGYKLYLQLMKQRGTEPNWNAVPMRIRQLELEL